MWQYTGNIRRKKTRLPFWRKIPCWRATSWKLCTALLAEGETEILLAPCCAFLGVLFFAPDYRHKVVLGADVGRVLPQLHKETKKMPSMHRKQRCCIPNLHGAEPFGSPFCQKRIPMKFKSFHSALYRICPMENWTRKWPETNIIFFIKHHSCFPIIYFVIRFNR